MNLTIAVGVVLGVAVLAFLMRRLSGEAPEQLSGPAPRAPEPEYARSLPPMAQATPEQAAEESRTAAVAPGRVVGVLAVGDLLGARVVRGAPGVDPWRLEGVGRDREYVDWSFETEAAARAALDLVERRVVRAPLDEDGEPAPLDAAQFEEARHVAEQTENELAMMPDEPEAEPGGERG
jgi:hypothetical protein